MELNDVAIVRGGFPLASLKSKTTIFYLLAFIPFIIIVYFNVFGIMIPILGFLLLYSKEEDLPFDQQTNLVQKIFGIIVMIGSFFLYFIWVPFVFSDMTFYNVTNYVVYVFGLCVGFFGLQSLKKVFTPLFLMVAAPSTSFISRWMESYMSSYVVSAVTNVTHASLIILGIPAIRDSPNIIILQTISGQRPISIIWDCVGIKSLLVFVVLLGVLFFEDASSARTKLLWSVFGVIGTIIVNFTRVTIIFVAIYLYGIEIGGFVHFSISYIFFFLWLGVFFYLFSKREAIAMKLRLIVRTRMC